MVELLVSISIVVLVLTITLTRQGSFNSAVLLRSEAFDLALAIREIQLSAVSATSDGSGEFRSTLGVHLDTATPNRYILFRDANANNAYDSGEAIGSPGIIDPRFELSTLRVDGDQSEVSVVFERPNFDALFFDGSANSITDAQLRVRLQMQGATTAVCGDDYREIEITAAGQIAVVNCT